MKMRYIPNILSISRIPFSIALPFLVTRVVPGEFKGWMIAFLVCYLIAGIVDVLDGLLARRFHWESELGAKMDSIGDGVFIVCVSIAAILGLGAGLKNGQGISLYNYIIFAAFAAFKIVNLIFTKAKFKQWGFLHLRTARWSVIPLYIAFPVCVFKGGVINALVAVCLAFSIVALVEEVAILAQMKPGEYTMNVKSIFQWRRDKRNAAAAPANEKEEAIV